MALGLAQTHNERFGNFSWYRKLRDYPTVRPKFITTRVEPNIYHQIKRIRETTKDLPIFMQTRPATSFEVIRKVIDPAPVNTR